MEGVDGKYTDYEYSQVTDVIDSGDPNMDNLTFSNAITLMGKIVEIALPLEPPVEKPDGDGKEEEKPVKPKSITGKVLEVYRDAEGIKLKVEVEVDGKIEVRDYLFDSVIGVKG